jgi:hypothetical protein
MAGYLENYGAGDERREKITKTVVLAVVALLVAIGLAYVFLHGARLSRR